MVMQAFGGGEIGCIIVSLQMTWWKNETPQSISTSAEQTNKSQKNASP